MYHFGGVDQRRLNILHPTRLIRHLNYCHTFVVV